MDWKSFLSARCRWLVPALILLAAFVLRGAYYRTSYGQVDEPITLEVVRHMQASGDWDTNWAKAAVPAEFRYGQYNFSSYIYATFWFGRFTALFPGLHDWNAMLDGYWVHRFFSVLLATLAVFQTWALARRLSGEFAALAAGLLVAVIPLLVQDAHYARPEAFVTVLTLLAASLCLSPVKNPRRRLFGVALVIGVLVACKISMLMLAWLPFVPLWTARAAAQPVRGLPQAALLAALGLALGFALGAPGAVLHPTIYVSGIQRLFTQYGGLQAPHSYKDGHVVAGMLAAYFIATLGWLLLGAGLLGAGKLLKERHWTGLAVIAGPILLFAGYFSTRTVFFERNLSHVVPLGCVLAGIGAGVAADWCAQRAPRLKVGLQAALLTAVLIQPAQITYRLVWSEFSGRNEKLIGQYEARLRAAFPQAEWIEIGPISPEPLEAFVKYVDRGAGLILLEVRDTQDEWSTPFSRFLPTRVDAVKIGEWPSTFAELPMCTLLTYVSPHRVYFLVRGKLKPKPAVAAGPAGSPGPPDSRPWRKGS